MTPAMTSTADKVNLLGLEPKALRAFCADIGEKPFRATQLLQWIHHYGAADFATMTNLGKELRARLTELAVIEAPEIVLDSQAQDGTRKWLLRLADGNCIETVFIPEGDREGRGRDFACADAAPGGPARAPIALADIPSAGLSPLSGPSARAPGRYRGTLCVSSQVGCTLNCSFCSTGHQGFNRNLTTAEIISQLWVANRALGRDPKGERVITNVVLMGMGEPLLNFEQVLPALRIMLDDLACGLSKRRVTLSTAGVVPLIDRLHAECPVSLAVSLHAPDDALRDELVPLNRKYPIAELLAACRRYVASDNRQRVTFEYVMLAGVNDSEAHARALARLLRNVPSKLNLIPFNPFPQTQYRRPQQAVIDRFREILIDAGYTTVTRKTRGQDIDAACGQLAGRVLDRTRRSRRAPQAGAGGP